MTRDRRIDTIRGILLAIMTIDHFGGYFRNFTYQPFGYVSAAEGFVFLSGYVCMEVYGRKTGEKDFLKPLYRGLKIYKHHILIALTIGLIASAIPQYYGYWHRDIGLYYKDPLKAIAFTVILLNQPTYMDILPMYSIFLVLFPISIHLIKIGKIKVLLFISFFIWVIGQYLNPISFITIKIDKSIDPGLFNIFAWQFVFILGVISGVVKDKPWLKNKKVFIVVLFSFFAILILRHINLPINNILLQERADFPVHRLLNLLVICTLFGFIIKKIPKGGKIKGFETLGRNSLQVFSFHVMLLYLLQPIGSRIEEYFGYKIFSFYVLFIVFTLFLPIYLVRRIKSSPITEYILKPQS